MTAQYLRFRSCRARCRVARFYLHMVSRYVRHVSYLDYNYHRSVLYRGATISCAWGLPELMRGILVFFFIAKICITNTKMFGGLVLSSGKDFGTRNHNESPELLQWVHDHGQGVSRVSVMEPQIFWFRNLCKGPS